MREQPDDEENDTEGDHVFTLSSLIRVPTWLLARVGVDTMRCSIGDEALSQNGRQPITVVQFERWRPSDLLSACATRVQSNADTRTQPSRRVTKTVHRLEAAGSSTDKGR